MNTSQLSHAEGSHWNRPAALTSDGLTAHRRSLPALTGLRFFAAGYVVLFHSHLALSLAEHGWPAAGHFFANGNLAVLLFFMLSGFILAYTYEAQIKTRTQMRRFWEARYSRIWPLYATSLLLSSLVYHSTPTPPIAAATLLMVQSWNPFNLEMAGAWNYVCWTLSAEAFFYLMFPAIQRWLERRSTRTQMSVLALMLLVTIVGNSGLHGFGYVPHGIYCYLPLALVRIPDFIVGICMGNIFLRLRPTFGEQVSGFLSEGGRGDLFTLLAAGICVVVLSHTEGLWTAFAGVGFAMLLVSLVVGNSSLQRLLSTRALLVGGQISYGMYLFQWSCKLGVNQICDRVGIGSQGLRFALGLILLLMLSTIGFYGIENPSRKYLRGVFARLERSPKAA